MEADEVGLLAERPRHLGPQRRHRLGMAGGQPADAVGEEAVALADLAGVARMRAGNDIEQPAEVAAQRGIIGQGQRRADAADRLPIRFHPGGIHPVEGGAAHQPDGSKHAMPVLRGRAARHKPGRGHPGTE